jgi:hypothetical protein
MKKAIAFTIFSASLIILMPMINSVETKLFEDEINEKVKLNISNSGINNDILNKINFLDNSSLLIKVLIFLWFGYMFGFAITPIIYYGRLPHIGKIILSLFAVFIMHIGGIFSIVTNFSSKPFIIFLFLDFLGINIVKFIESYNSTGFKYLIGIILFGIIQSLMFEFSIFTPI